MLEEAQQSVEDTSGGSRGAASEAAGASTSTMGATCCAFRGSSANAWDIFGGPKASPLVAPKGGVTVATWNIAAINNNPFEYWITHDDDLYLKLMAGVEQFIEDPGDRDVKISDVFTDSMFEELFASMEAEGWEHLEKVRKFWDDDYRGRTIVQGFMKDKAIGAKRLASMPDRITNTINVMHSDMPVCRPTVVNNYVGDLESLEVWWPAWKEFMFKNPLEIDFKGTPKVQRPCQMLSKISRSKYPALTEEEELISLPLQCLCQAIFDAILVHMMCTLSPDGKWQLIKASIVEAVFSKKNTNTLKILLGPCADIDVILLQECAASFNEVLTKRLGQDYLVLSPQDLDPKRDQNSMIMLRKARFMDDVKEVTAEVLAELGTGAPVDRGDLIAVVAQGCMGEPYLIASFHGDTNGLATKPVVSAVNKVLAKQPAGCRLIFGLDANTYLKPKEGLQSVGDFIEHCEGLGIRTCWEDGKPLDECFTCCNARTYVQPQLNKAIRSVDKLTKGDKNPKDHILFQRKMFQVTQVYKDNTGERKYSEEECFPTLRFPSDHGIVSIVLEPGEDWEY